MNSSSLFGDGMTPAEKKNLDYFYRSKVDRLEGQVQELIEAGRRNASKIEKLEVKQRVLDELRANLS